MLNSCLNLLSAISTFPCFRVLPNLSTDFHAFVQIYYGHNIFVNNDKSWRKLFSYWVCYVHNYTIDITSLKYQSLITVKNQVQVWSPPQGQLVFHSGRNFQLDSEHVMRDGVQYLLSNLKFNVQITCVTNPSCWVSAHEVSLSWTDYHRIHGLRFKLIYKN